VTALVELVQHFTRNLAITDMLHVSSQYGKLHKGLQ